MKEVARVDSGDWSYPVYLDDEGFYHIDLGGSVGLSDPFEFANDDKAVSFFAEAIKNEGY